jgi:CDP-4-dehydro-6-deoxyglucose reductase/terephthalate 1,2-dioxygenase reductase component
MTAVHRAQVAGSELAFDCAPGQSVLDAALQAGIELPHSCRKGVCGSCAAVVSEGELRALPGRALVNEHCGPGRQLLCAGSAATPLLLVVPGARRLEPGARKRLQAKVFRVREAAPGIWLLDLRLPAGQRLKFRAGQHLEVIESDGSRRAYSMANPPHESDAVALHIRSQPGGLFSARLPTLQPGELIDIEAPQGSIGLREGGTAPLLMVAGGTGFAPIKSMLDHLAKLGAPREITLLWGVREARQLYLPAALARWRRVWPDLRALALVSGGVTEGGAENGEGAAARDAGWSVESGRVPERLGQLAADRASGFAGHEAYVCGSPGFVDAVRGMLLQCGLPVQDCFADAFVSAAPAARA